MADVLGRYIACLSERNNTVCSRAKSRPSGIFSSARHSRAASGCRAGQLQAELGQKSAQAPPTFSSAGHVVARGRATGCLRSAMKLPAQTLAARCIPR